MSIRPEMVEIAFDLGAAQDPTDPAHADRALVEEAIREELDAFGFGGVGDFDMDDLIDAYAKGVAYANGEDQWI